MEALGREPVHQVPGSAVPVHRHPTLALALKKTRENTLHENPTSQRLMMLFLWPSRPFGRLAPQPHLPQLRAWSRPMKLFAPADFSEGSGAPGVTLDR